MSDLVVLVPDGNTEQAILGLLSRPQSLGIRAISYEVYVHIQRDPGVLLGAHEFLRSHQRSHRHCLVLLDHEGCGQESKNSGDIEQEITQNLISTGWENNHCEVIVIEPELDKWVWSNSPHVEQALRWQGRQPRLREWLIAQGYQFDEHGKPVRPKEALEAALRIARKPRSSSLYRGLAEKVSLANCIDPSFGKLRAVLSQWFP